MSPHYERISVILEPGQKQALENIARELSYRYGRSVNVSDIVRHVLKQFLQVADEPALRRIAEEKGEYRTG